MTERGKESGAFAVDLSVFVRHGGGFEALPTLSTAKAAFMPRLQKKEDKMYKNDTFEFASWFHKSI